MFFKPGLIKTMCLSLRILDFPLVTFAYCVTSEQCSQGIDTWNEIGEFAHERVNFSGNHAVTFDHISTCQFVSMTVKLFKTAMKKL